MSFTKFQCSEIADILGSTIPIEEEEKRIHLEICMNLAKKFERTCLRFNKEKFLAMCGWAKTREQLDIDMKIWRNFKGKRIIKEKEEEENNGENNNPDGYEENYGIIENNREDK